MSRLMVVEVPSYSCEFKGIREVYELVRCKEYKKSHIDGKTTHYLWCTEWDRSTDAFGYCERGEREGE